MDKHKLNKYIPTYYANSVYDIDFSKLYANGKKIILTDLDNTLISYRLKQADEKLQQLNDLLYELGYQIYIVSNNNEKRIEEISKTFKIDGYLIKARKPKEKKLNDFLKNHSFNKEEVIFIGDQLVTDIACANNVEIDSILVGTIDVKTQKWYTKINRLRERRIVKKIKRKDCLVGELITKTLNKQLTNE